MNAAIGELAANAAAFLRDAGAEMLAFQATNGDTYDSTTLSTVPGSPITWNALGLLVSFSVEELRDSRILAKDRKLLTLPDARIVPQVGVTVGGKVYTVIAPVQERGAGSYATFQVRA